MDHLQRRTLVDHEHFVIPQLGEGQVGCFWWDLKYSYVFLRNNCWESLSRDNWVKRLFKKVGAIAKVQGPPAELPPYAADTSTWLFSMWNEASDLKGQHKTLVVKGVG